MGLASYEIIGSGGESRMSHDGKARSLSDQKPPSKPQSGRVAGASAGP